MKNILESNEFAAGRMMECGLGQFAERCASHIQEEQRKSSPDNMLIETLCNAIRLARQVNDDIISPKLERRWRKYER